MGKGKRLKGKRRRMGSGILAEVTNRLTANFQRELRNSELWGEMVAEFGEKRAEELLRECKAELRPGLPPYESGGRTKDIL